MNHRPSYQVAVAGLESRDQRLIEIIFQHCPYNSYGYQMVGVDALETADIAIVNPFDPAGLGALAKMRAKSLNVAVITALPRGASSASRHAMAIERLTLQLLPILNRVVQLEIQPGNHTPQVFRRPAESAPIAKPDGIESGKSVQAGPLAHSAHRSAPQVGVASTSPVVSRVRPAPTEAAPTEAADRRVDPEPTTIVDGGFGTTTLLDIEFPATEFPQTIPLQQAPPSSILIKQLRDEHDATRSLADKPIPDNLVAFPNSTESAATPISVLVVDDSPTVRRQMGLALNRMGIRGVAVSSASSALERMDNEHFELALVDVVMDDMDGYQLTRAIRRKHKSTPVIILTSRTSPIDLARGALAGCSSFLIKPVPMRKLEAAILKQLRKTLAIDDLEDMLKTTAVRPSKRVDNNVQQLRRRVKQR